MTWRRTGRSRWSPGRAGRRCRTAARPPGGGRGAAPGTARHVVGVPARAPHPAGGIQRAVADDLADPAARGVGAAVRAGRDTAGAAGGPAGRGGAARAPVPGARPGGAPRGGPALGRDPPGALDRAPRRGRDGVRVVARQPRARSSRGAGSWTRSTCATRCTTTGPRRPPRTARRGPRSTWTAGCWSRRPPSTWTATRRRCATASAGNCARDGLVIRERTWDRRFPRHPW